MRDPPQLEVVAVTCRRHTPKYESQNNSAMLLSLFDCYYALLHISLIGKEEDTRASLGKEMATLPCAGRSTSELYTGNASGSFKQSEYIG
jgi:hypothetical protein